MLWITSFQDGAITQVTLISINANRKLNYKLRGNFCKNQTPISVIFLTLLQTLIFVQLIDKNKLLRFIFQKVIGCQLKFCQLKFGLLSTWQSFLGVITTLRPNFLRSQGLHMICTLDTVSTTGILSPNKRNIQTFSCNHWLF